MSNTITQHQIYLRRKAEIEHRRKMQMERENQEYIFTKTPAGKFFNIVLNDINNNEQVKNSILTLMGDQERLVEILQWTGGRINSIISSKLPQYSGRIINQYEADHIDEQLNQNSIEYNITTGVFSGCIMNFKKDYLFPCFPFLYYRIIITLERR